MLNLFPPGTRNTALINITLLGIILLSFAMYLWDIQRDLPIVQDNDEAIYVSRAIKMAAFGNLNPEWFGNPGSTTIYPLAAIYHVWFATTRQGVFFGTNPIMQQKFLEDPWEYYYVGRLLSVVYTILSIPLVYLLGKQALNRSIGLIGTSFFVLYPLIMHYSRVVRTDNAAMFFGTVSLLFLIKAYQRPSLRNHTFAGMFIGFSIASRYFMIALLPLLMIADGIILGTHKVKKLSHALWRVLAAGICAVVIGFLLAAPYFVFSLDIVSNNLRYEARNSSLGQDGFSPIENLWWYLSSVLPDTITWPQLILAVLGILLLFKKPDVPRFLLLGFVAIFLIGISSSALHWERWIIQILPVMALFAAYGLVESTNTMARVSGLTLRYQFIALVVMTVLLFGWSVLRAISINLDAYKTNTRIAAREWLLDNLPADSKIIQDAWIPLSGTFINSKSIHALPNAGIAFDNSHETGYQYVVITSAKYERFFAEPDRYQSQIDFYNALFTTGKLRRKFEPSSALRGPTILVYELY